MTMKIERPINNPKDIAHIVLELLKAKLMKLSKKTKSVLDDLRNQYQCHDGMLRRCLKI